MTRCVVGGVALLFLAGCIDLKVGAKKTKLKVSANDVVLAKINQEPVITKDEFYKELSAQMRNMDPSLLPLNMQRKILDDLIRVKLMVVAAEKDGVEKEAEFKEAFEEQVGRLKELLLTRFYSKKLFDSIEVADKDAVEEYVKNKDKYVKEPGGTLVQGVSFEDRAKALAFYDTVRNEIPGFEKIAKNQKDGKFKDFGRVSKDGQPAGLVPAFITEATLKFSNLPAVDVVKDGESTWVIAAIDKKAPIMFELNEIKEQLVNQLKYSKFKDVYEKHANDLRSKFVVDVNEEFFKESLAQGKEEAVEIKEESFDTEDDSSRTL